MALHSFFRSGTSHRVRIALNLKGISAEYHPVDLRTDAHLAAAFKAINPQALVPVLTVGSEHLIQSPAILEWLDETYPEPPLLPKDSFARARVRALAAMVGCDVHPLNNRRILMYLRSQFGADEAAVNTWCATWIGTAFDALEVMLAADKTRGDFCHGGQPSMADVYLVPQIESARRFGVDLAAWPHIMAIDVACQAIPAFANAAPSRQPDAA
ncbi:maleylacetoacetate isomerase [Betaproteobacteria bacterium LSUCC0117]|nr:maleylacetoacetate isomerase [Betaproteobacteria bacterium LSUCC0117]